MIINGNKHIKLLILNLLITGSVFSIFFVIVAFSYFNNGIDNYLYLPILVSSVMIFSILLNDAYQYSKAPRYIKVDLSNHHFIANGGTPVAFKKMFFVSNSGSSKAYRLVIINSNGKKHFLTRHYYFDKTIREINQHIVSVNSSRLQAMSSFKYGSRNWT